MSRAGRIAIVGRPNVGKSTLLNALLGERLAIVSPKPQTTRDRILGVLTRGDAQLCLLDTPGLHEATTRLGRRMNTEAREAIEGADVVVLVTEPGVGVGDVERALLAAAGRRPVVCALNKVDRVAPKARLLPVLAALGQAHGFAAVVPLSALRDDGLDRLLREIEPLLPEGEHPHAADELTDKPVRFFVAELVREQVLQRAWQEVPHGVAVVVEKFDEGGRVVRIEATIHVPKESHKRILVGKGGAFLSGVGRAAREQIERLVGRQVHLALWVRVTPGWFDREELLREVGYRP